MNGRPRHGTPRRKRTSTAATPRTEPEIVAGIASAEGQPTAHGEGRPFPAPRSRLVLTLALALGAAAGSWLHRASLRS